MFYNIADIFLALRSYVIFGSRSSYTFLAAESFHVVSSVLKDLELMQKRGNRRISLDEAIESLIDEYYSKRTKKET